MCEIVSMQGANRRRTVLDSIATDLTDNVNMDTLLPFLQKHHLVTSDESYQLGNNIHSPGEKVQILLKGLKKKGNECLQRFLCCLNSANNAI